MTCILRERKKQREREREKKKERNRNFTIFPPPIPCFTCNYDVYIHNIPIGERERQRAREEMYFLHSTNFTTGTKNRSKLLGKQLFQK